MKEIKFPKDFKWGVSSSAYQIEGATKEDGRGLSIWDEFTRRPGVIPDNSNGDVACDHYHRYQEDFALIKQLNIRNYRFSIAWPRIFPDGFGGVNQKGLDHYDKVIDELLKNEIESFITLYHWDLPLELEKIGGWVNRETIHHFTDYVETVVKRYSDRVKNWITLNEPGVEYYLAYQDGRHAPGKKGVKASIKALHNLLLAHGYSMERIKSIDSRLQVGLVDTIAPSHPLRGKKDKKAVELMDGYSSRLIPDAILLGHYPKAIAGNFRFLCKEIKDSDFDIISKPIDFLGVNNYFRFIVKRVFWPPFPGFKPVEMDYEGIKRTDCGWEIYPECMYESLKMICETYNNPAVYLTENGAAFNDIVENGRVHDQQRIDFFKSYISMLHKALEEGCNVKGYFVWSLLDDFEWDFGYIHRFGLVHVDYETQKRTIKDSGYWYSQLCKENKFTI